ncbi:hypothetical protein BG006_004939 [Podila minutissima]|uniref:Alpha/beta hydrolase fold-3 domain-containing protein n=1 Tax=Podila minutissima TaxID=64525 RepID=A0A9P5SKG4_9FUNG|nr:hypothetical protein BG006_004939 [Podila minutissima]
MDLLRAFGRSSPRVVAGIIKFAFLHWRGRTPKGLHFKHGAVIAALSRAGDGVSNEQTRKLYNHGRSKNAVIEAKWTTAVDGKGWTGFWIPFQCEVPDAKTGCDASTLGQGCDLVLLYTHGGGFIYGHPLQNTVFMTELIHHTFVTKGIRLSFLVIDYNGDSAGGNLAHVLPLKIRDECPELGLPIGTIASSPYMFSPHPVDISIYDFITPLVCQRFVRAYSHYDPSTLASSYFIPLNAESLGGLPPMLVFIGGLEQFRPSIECFVKKAQADKCAVKVILAEARAHCWFLTPAISTPQDRVDAIEACTQFLANILKEE